MAIQDSTHSISASAKRFFSGTAISRASGLIREVAMAAVFGTSATVAAFWMAFRFAYLLRRIFGEGALNAAFIPHFETLRKQNSEASARFFYELSTGVALCLFFITILAEAVLGAALLFFSISEANQEIIRLTMLMLPALIFISLYALNTSLLNCERFFFLPSVAPSALNFVWILAIFLLWNQPEVKAIEYLSMLLVGAFALQWLVTVPSVFRYLSKELKEKWWENRLSGREMLHILRPFALGIVGVCATQINSALDAIFARAADPQGPAYLWYALRIQQLPLALFGVGLVGALLPPISRSVQGDQKNSYLNFLNFALKRSVLLMLPMTVAVFALGFSGINLVYGHGEFSKEATYATTLCLWAYGAALLPMTVTLILASAFYAHKNYKIPTLLALLSVALNCLLNALFVFIFHLGAISIALATALSAVINSVGLALLLRKTYGLDVSNILAATLKVFIASSLALTLTLFLGASFFHDNTLFWLLGKELFLFPRELFSQLVAFSVQALSFFLTFLLAAYLLNIREIFSLFFDKKQKRVTSG